MCVRKSGLTAFVVFLSLFILLFSAASFGQVTSSTIVGSVTDASGAAVAGAQVTAINTATNYSRTVQTNNQGEYRLEFLPVGTYRVEMTAPGFQKLVRNGVVLEIAQPSRVDAQLQLGQVSQTVEVVSEVPLVNTTNPEIGRTIETKEIENLPIVNRNVYTLLDLTPGVQRSDNSIVLGYPEQRTLINGGVDVGAGSVNYYLDGGSNMTGIRNTGNILPNPDAIQEFRVQTNSYNAEYGRFQNGVVNVLTKSGTNAIHGSAFEFVRNNIFNANDWGSSLPTPALHRNQFGATIGGPIIKNKTFFFGSYGGLRQTTSTFESSAVIPSAAELSGNFSGAAGGIIPVDPSTGKPFPNNTIPATRMDPAAVAILKQYVPAANAPNNHWQGFIPNPYNTDEFLAKIDHNLSDNQRLTFSYFETSGNNNIVAGSSNLPWGLQQFNWRQHNANVSDTWTMSPTLINQVWATYTRNFGGRLNTPSLSLASFGSAFTPDGPPSLPDITINNFFHLADAIGGPVTGTNFYSLRDVVSWNHGRHSISFGAEESLDKDIQQSLLNNYGVFQFNGSSTTPSGLAKGVTCQDCPLADFELGIPSKVQQDAPSYGFTNSWYTAFFVQDDFRLKPRFTLNLGLRWDIQTPPTDPQNKESTFVPGVQSVVRPTAPAGILFPGDPGITRGIVPIRWNHVSPRVGFAFDPFGDGKTSIRAAAGMFWGSVSGNEWNTTSNFEPFAIRINPFANVNKKGTGATLSNPYQGFVGGNPFPYKGTFVNGATIFGPATNFQWPYTYQLSASIQRQVTNTLSVQMAYVGSLSHNEPFATDINYPLPSSALAPTPSTSNFQLRRPNQNFGIIYALRSNQTASYNGMQISAVERLSHHVSFNGWYAWSNTFDSVQIDNNTAQGLVEDFSNPRLDRGPADIDMRHQAVVSMIWQPDYYTGDNRFISGVANGWSIAPVFRIHSGLPFTVSNNGVDANLDGQTNDRAQQIGDPHIANPNVGQWFNTAAFVQIPAGSTPIDGNAPRNGLRAPGYKNLDLALFRRFSLTERFKLEFRAEAANALNIANYSTPNASVGSKNFGQILSAGAMRQLQLGLRLTY
jgi:hypothetical protein